jgi:hypothetical protein
MDSITREFFEWKFERAFMTKKGQEFQDFFSTIMEKRYPGDFTRSALGARSATRRTTAT